MQSSKFTSQFNPRKPATKDLYQVKPTLVLSPITFQPTGSHFNLLLWLGPQKGSTFQTVDTMSELASKQLNRVGYLARGYKQCLF